jgi:ADP-ribosylglycohydrolase
MAGARALQADVDDGPPGGLPRGDRLAGLLLGTALGDALGLPAEGLSRRRIARLGWNGRWRQRFLCGRGMTSDDTEHTVFVAESLLRSPPDPNAFARLLAWRLRLWLLAVPAGIGFATLRACLKLWLGFPPSRSGVYSAGNGPAMRAAIIGAWFAGDRAGLDAFVRASTTLTHTDPRAFTGALAVALCAESAMLARDGTMTLAALTESAPEDAEWQGCLARIRLGLANGWKVETFCRELGCPNGVSGYIYQTVPVAVFAFLQARDFRTALEDALDCGGDTDTVGAITGALLGCRFGVATLPSEWLAGMAEFPKGVGYLRRLAVCLDGGSEVPTCRGWLLPLRQALFAVTVLVHAVRRGFPPW